MAAIGLFLANPVGFSDPATESRPNGCRQAGIDCGECVRQAADELVSLSPRLEISHAQALFARLYPDPGCRPMLVPFAVACREAVRRFETEEAELELASSAAFA